MSRWSLGDTLDPDEPPPPRCELHGTELDGEFCEACYLTIYESAWTWEDEADDRSDRDRE